MPMIECPNCGQLNHTEDRDYCKCCGDSLHSCGEMKLLPWWMNPSYWLPKEISLLIFCIFLFIILLPVLSKEERFCRSMGYGIGYSSNGYVACGDLKAEPKVDFDMYCIENGYDNGRYPYCIKLFEGEP